MHIPAYCSIDYLEEITRKTLIDYMQPEKTLQGRTVFDLLELITEGLNIRTDCPPEKIEERRTTNPYINFLIKGNRIKAAISEFQQLRTNEDEFFTSAEKGVKLFLLSETYVSRIKDYQDKSGYYFLTPSTDNQLLFDEEIETFERSSQKTWAFAERFFNPHHSIVVADPYLYKEVSRRSLKEMLEKILPKKLLTPYHISLVGSDKNRKNDLPDANNITEWAAGLRNWINTIVNTASFECHIYNKEDFHDRYIITNNTCIFSGYGLNIIKNNHETQRDGTWLALKPFKRVNVNGLKGVIFLKIMKDKLGIIKTWIGNSNSPDSSNPLFL